MCVYVAVIRFLHVFIVRFGHVYVTLAMAYVFARYAHFMLSSRLPRHAASLPFRGRRLYVYKRHVLALFYQLLTISIDC